MITSQVVSHCSKSSSVRVIASLCEEMECPLSSVAHDHHINDLHLDPSRPAIITALVQWLSVVRPPQLSTTVLEWLAPPSQCHLTRQATLDQMLRKAFALAQTTLLEALW